MYNRLDTDRTVELTERQEEKLQVAENRWVRRICRVKREDSRKMEELRDEIRMKKPKEESSWKQNKMDGACTKNV